jgi:hypothetical protein
MLVTNQLGRTPPAEIRKQIDDYVRQSFHEKFKKSVVQINPLEFAAQIITYMMCIVVLQQDAYATRHAVVLLRGDNKAANAWSESYSIKKYSGCALTRLLREVIRPSNGTGQTIEHWPGKKNFFVDDLSRMHVKPLRKVLENTHSRNPFDLP